MIGCISIIVTEFSKSAPLKQRFISAFISFKEKRQDKRDHIIARIIVHGLEFSSTAISSSYSYIVTSCLPRQFSRYLPLLCSCAHDGDCSKHVSYKSPFVCEGWKERKGRLWREDKALPQPSLLSVLELLQNGDILVAKFLCSTRRSFK